MKPKTYEDCIIEKNGVTYCVFCGNEIINGETCTCNKAQLAIRNFGLIATAQGQVERYQGTIAELEGRQPDICYELGEAIVRVPVEEPPTEEGESE